MRVLARSFVLVLAVGASAPVMGQTGPLGTNYCDPAVPNSTGQSGVISAFGSPLIAANDVTLTASNMPNDFGYFLSSRTQGLFYPTTTCSGLLCLNGSIGRHNQPGQVHQGPSISIALDLGTIPTPTGFVAVQPGETWHFTAWYRDWGCTNFTDGLAITFQ